MVPAGVKTTGATAVTDETRLLPQHLASLTVSGGRSRVRSIRTPRPTGSQAPANRDPRHGPAVAGLLLLAVMLPSCGGGTASPVAASGTAASSSSLTADDARRIVEQAAAAARAAGLPSTIAVTDAEANVLAVFRMDGAQPTSRVAGDGGGLEGRVFGSDTVAVAKAASATLLSSGGNAFSTRTASFIVESHFPPGVDFTPGGPLFGVQLSSLPCGDVKRPGSPLGIGGDPGGVPLYRDGVIVGGLGVEADGVYGIDNDPASAPPEESVALAGAAGFDAPALVRASEILADGIRLPYANGSAAPAGSGAGSGTWIALPRSAPPSALVPATVGGVPGRSDPRFPTRAGTLLAAAEVAAILDQAAGQSAKTRAAIRQPLGSSARVSIAVVDTTGAVLAFFQVGDAPNFGLDVSVQKARTAAFFSSDSAGVELARAGLGAYLADDVPLDGRYAYTSRAIGFLAQPFYPPGIGGAGFGPFSRPIEEWSPFDTGLQLDLLNLAGAGSCTAIARLPNGITLFPGGIPLFKDGRLAGAVGVSGDGVDQDDLIASAGASAFEVPAEKRSDQLVVRGTRLPWVKSPRHPEL